MQAKQYHSKKILIEATQWFKNGDHPKDHVMRAYEDTGELPTEPREGAVVRYFRHPSSKGIEICPNCGKSNHDHGWIDVRGGGITVCPGDFVVTWPIEGGYMYRVLKPDQFADEFEGADANAPYQMRVESWLRLCFGEQIAYDKVERIDRFIEEALELSQSLGHSRDRVLSLVDYVFNRPAGEPEQELGGVMVTLAALCPAHDLDMEHCAEKEYSRIMQPEIVEKICAKQKAKPTGSALPE